MEDRDAYKTQRIINSVFYEAANWWMAERLAELMAGLMMDSKYSDLTLECDGEKFAVHKAVVVTQSVVLEKACQGPWKEGVDNVIHIKEFDAQTVRRMVEFLYTGDYDQGKPEYVNPEKDDVFLKAENAQDANINDDDLYPLSEQFSNHVLGIESLEDGIFDISINAYQPSSPSVSASEVKEWEPDDQTAANEFLDAFSPQLDVHAIADYYMLKDLEKKAIDKVKLLLKRTVWSAKGFLTLANEVFETTMPATSAAANKEQKSETLRDIILTTASEHFPQITRAYEFTRLDLNSEFAALLLQNIAKKYKALRAELGYQERDNMERWTVSTRRISELINYMSQLQAQNAALDDCIKRIHGMVTCEVCGCPFNVLICEEGEASNDTDDDDDDDDGYDADDDSVDNLATAVGTQEQKVKKYVIECKKCSLHGTRSGDLLQGSSFGPYDGDELFEGIADLFVDELPAEPWLHGDNDEFAGALYPEAADDL